MSYQEILDTILSFINRRESDETFTVNELRGSILKEKLLDLPEKNITVGFVFELLNKLADDGNIDRIGNSDSISDAKFYQKLDGKIFASYTRYSKIKSEKAKASDFILERLITIDYTSSVFTYDVKKGFMLNNEDIIELFEYIYNRFPKLFEVRNTNYGYAIRMAIEDKRTLIDFLLAGGFKDSDFDIIDKVITVRIEEKPKTLWKKSVTFISELDKIWKFIGTVFLFFGISLTQKSCRDKYNNIANKFNCSIYSTDSTANDKTKK